MSDSRVRSDLLSIFSYSGNMVHNWTFCHDLKSVLLCILAWWAYVILKCFNAATQVHPWILLLLFLSWFFYTTPTWTYLAKWSPLKTWITAHVFSLLGPIWTPCQWYSSAAHSPSIHSINCASCVFTQYEKENHKPGLRTHSDSPKFRQINYTIAKFVKPDLVIFRQVPSGNLNLHQK
jgi:hypothetical protein